MPSIERVCDLCGIRKPEGAFPVDPSTEDRRSETCERCLQDERVSYGTSKIIASEVQSPMDRTSDWWKYLIANYLYLRSRLVVPGKSYEDESSGMLEMGSAAHCDVLDLEAFISMLGDESKDTTYDWTFDTSQEEVAQRKGYVGRGGSQPTISRRRDRLADRAEQALNQNR